MPWILAGDFNEPLLEDDKFGGRVVSISRSLLLKDCLDKCNMIDIGFSGPRFTWMNKREVQALIQERIDRFFVNPSWCLRYPDARVVHLTRCHSDHCLVLLEAVPRVHMGKPKPFKFQTCWLTDSSFPKVVTQAWGQANGLMNVIENFAKDATSWNKQQFGNVFARKKNLMARLNGIQRAVSVRPSTFLLNLEKELLKEFEIVLSQEEELWALISRVNWLIQVLTLVRRKRNQIRAIKNSMWEWISDENEVKEFISRGFSDVYSSSLCVVSRQPLTISQWQIKLLDEVRDSISGGVTEEEIKAAIWSLKAFKALGPNGLHAGFYQRFWLIVGKLVIEEVKRVFTERKVPTYLNQTHIAFIPKIQSSETWAILDL